MPEKKKKELTAKQMAEGVKSGKLSAVELAKEVLVGQDHGDPALQG